MTRNSIATREIGENVKNRETLHSRVLANLTTGVLLLDSGLRIIYINLAAEALLAVSGRQVHRACIADIFLDSEQDVEDICSARDGSYSFTRRQTQLYLVHGNSIAVDYTITPFPSGDEVQIVMELQPLNYADRINKDEALVSTHETTRELVKGLAHEIKNPLGGIRGAAQLLARELPDSGLTDYTNVIIEEADRLRNLVDQMAGYRKLPEFRTLNIHEVLERVRSLVEAETACDNIEIIRNYDPSIPALQGDFEQLIQAFLNIVRNAVQALAPERKSSEGVTGDKGPGRIELKSRVLRNATISSTFHRLVARVEVIDDGPGIPPGLLGNIFYPMISGRADGTGLGLSIAHSVIHQHRGLIECESKPGCTRFAIYIPISPTVTGDVSDK